MTPDTLIEDDLACTRCRYNLRTLRAGELCPECGVPIIRSLVRAVPGQGWEFDVGPPALTPRRLRLMADFIGIQPQAI